jgi:hypothetical protein
MATWFMVIGRIAQIENILDSNYKNALVIYSLKLESKNHFKFPE